MNQNNVYYLQQFSKKKVNKIMQQVIQLNFSSHCLNTVD